MTAVISPLNHAVVPVVHHSWWWHVVNTTHWTNHESGVLGAALGGAAVLAAAVIAGRQQAKQARNDHARVAAAEILDALVDLTQRASTLSLVSMRPETARQRGLSEERTAVLEAALKFTRVATSRAPLVQHRTVARLAFASSAMINKWFVASIAYPRAASAGEATVNYLTYCCAQVANWLNNGSTRPFVLPPDLQDEASCASWEAPEQPHGSRGLRLWRRRPPQRLNDADSGSER